MKTKTFTTEQLEAMKEIVNEKGVTPETINEILKSVTGTSGKSRESIEAYFRKQVTKSFDTKFANAEGEELDELKKQLIEAEVAKRVNRYYTEGAGSEKYKAEKAAQAAAVAAKSSEKKSSKK